MNIDVIASDDVKTNGGGTIPPCISLTSNALPEVQKSVLTENSDTGVSTRNVPFGNEVAYHSHYRPDEAHWYALRTTYGREKKAYDYIIKNGGTAFLPTIETIKVVDGKRKRVEGSRLPNIFFAHGTEEEIKKFVYDNVHLPFLRFYYRHFHFGNKIEKEPLIVPDNQIESLRIICKAESDDIILSTDDVPKFQAGQTVRVIEGKFKGVVGVVARYQGQQRVGIVINGLLTVATAYIPSAFIEVKTD